MFFEIKYFFHLTKYFWLFCVKIVLISYFFSYWKWNVFCINVFEFADFNSETWKIKCILMLKNKFNSWLTDFFCCLMKNKSIFTWFNFLLIFFILRFLINRYIYIFLTEALFFVFCFNKQWISVAFERCYYEFFWAFLHASSQTILIHVVIFFQTDLTFFLKFAKNEIFFVVLNTLKLNVNCVMNNNSIQLFWVMLT